MMIKGTLFTGVEVDPRKSSGTTRAHCEKCGCERFVRFSAYSGVVGLTCPTCGSRESIELKKLD